MSIILQNIIGFQYIIFFNFNLLIILKYIGREHRWWFLRNVILALWLPVKKTMGNTNLRCFFFSICFYFNYKLCNCFSIFWIDDVTLICVIFLQLPSTSRDLKIISSYWDLIFALLFFWSDLQANPYPCPTQKSNQIKEKERSLIQIHMKILLKPGDWFIVHLSCNFLKCVMIFYELKWIGHLLFLFRFQIMLIKSFRSYFNSSKIQFISYELAKSLREKWVCFTVFLIYFYL